MRSTRSTSIGCTKILVTILMTESKMTVSSNLGGKTSLIANAILKCTIWSMRGKFHLNPHSGDFQNMSS